MAVHFLDTSALLKAYVEEKGTGKTLQLLHHTLPPDVYISRVTIAEVPGAMEIVRRRDEQSRREFSEQQRQEAVRRFLEAVHEGRFTIVELTEPVSLDAAELTIRRRLRTYDAIQLASARAVRALLPEADTPLTFVCSDRGLKTAAKNEGFQIFDPEHPSDESLRV